MTISNSNFYKHEQHPFHLVDPSPWPFLCSWSALMFATSFIHCIHGYSYSLLKLFFSFSILILFVSLWFTDIVTEATFEGHHTFRVETGLRYGMILFITSEVMLFLSFFSLYFYFTEEPSPQLILDI